MVEFFLRSLIREILKLLYNLIQISLKFDIGHFNFTQIQFIQMIMMQSNKIGCSMSSARRQMRSSSSNLDHQPPCDNLDDDDLICRLADDIEQPFSLLCIIIICMN